jgi:hypothetical protein
LTRPVPGLFDLARGRAVEPTADLVDSALEHGMAGLLAAAVEAGDVDLDRSSRIRLGAYQAAAAEKHRRLWATLAQLIGLLSAAGIDAYAIKGVTNEARWFDGLGQRPGSDVDLVLAPHHLDRVDEVLGLLAPDHPSRRAIVDLVAGRRLQHVTFLHGDVVVDFHFDPLKLGAWARRPDRLWETATEIAAPDGRPIPVLATGPALALALIHLNKDRFAYLGAYVEVARMLADPDLDRAAFDRLLVDELIEVAVRCSLAEVVERLSLDSGDTWPAGPSALAWRALWPPASRLRGREARQDRRFRQALIPHLGLERRGAALGELRRRVAPPRALLDLHRPDLAGHHYLRRVTVDRLPGWVRLTGGPDPASRRGRRSRRPHRPVR